MQKGESLRMTILYVDSYDDAVPSGRLCHLQLGEPQYFHGLTDLLIRLEQKFNETKFPQAFQTLRTFQKTREVKFEQKAEKAPLKGKLATFSIKLLFRQNASWQGSIHWLEGNVEESFRSVLELIFLMDSALRQSKK